MHLIPQLGRRQGDPPPTITSNTLETIVASSSVTTSASGSTSTTASSLIPIPSSRISTPSRTAIVATARPTQVNTDRRNDGGSNYIIPLIIVLSILLTSIILFQIVRIVRRKYPNPKYIPTPFLKQAWRKWMPSQGGWRITRNDRGGNFEPIGAAAARRLGPPAPARSATAAGGSGSQGDGTGDLGTATVDRNTSVRSVMTLPAYRPNAHHNEQVLGREGDRGGIDVVVEFPETADDEERAREEEMAALYQVRLARRRENEERDERRRLRREARERGDFVALREIQERSRASNAARAGNTADELRAEHERIKRERNRAVSSVSYADLGVARHDGTRIRANSEESERTGLLGDAASFGASSNYHRRDRSASSVLSIDTMNSDLPSPEFARARADSRASGIESPLRRMSTQDGVSVNSGRAGSSPEIIEHEDASTHSPPGYENISIDTPSIAPEPQYSHLREPPPDYTSPVVDRGEGRSLTESRFPVSENREISPDSRRASPDLQTMLTQSGERGSAPSARGVGGVPQLPSLRLTNLPSIQVDPGSPMVGRENERSTG